MIETNAALRTEVSKLQGTTDGLATDLQNNVEDLVGLLHKADVRAQGLQDQIRVQHAHLHQHDADLARHEGIKVNVGAFEIFQQEMADTVANLRARHQACEDNVQAKYEWTVAELNGLHTKVDNLEEKVFTRLDNLALEISAEIDEKCAKTLANAIEHTDAIAKKHRDKLAKQKSDLATLRTDFEEAKIAQKEALQEAQRTLRSELSAAAAAIHDAIKNLNEKQAATKAAQPHG
jgi:hypothetical protein